MNCGRVSLAESYPDILCEQKSGKSAIVPRPCHFWKFYYYYYNFYKGWIKILSLSLSFTTPIYPNTDLICVNQCVFISIYTKCVGVMCETNNEDLRYLEYKAVSMHSGRVGEMHRDLFSSVYKQFFSCQILSSELWLNPLFWGCYSSSSLHNWYLTLESWYMKLRWKIFF